MSVYHKHNNRKVEVGDNIITKHGYMVRVTMIDLPCTFKSGARIEGEYLDPDIHKNMGGKPGTFALFDLEGVFHSTDTRPVFKG